MNTQEHKIYDEQFSRWLSDKAKASGIAGLELILTTNGCGFIACVNRGSHISENAPTVDAAIAKVRAQIPTPEQLAQQKRKQAEKLLAEAEAIEESRREVAAN